MKNFKKYLRPALSACCLCILVSPSSFAATATEEAAKRAADKAETSRDKAVAEAAIAKAAREEANAIFMAAIKPARDAARADNDAEEAMNTAQAARDKAFDADATAKNAYRVAQEKAGKDCPAAKAAAETAKKAYAAAKAAAAEASEAASKTDAAFNDAVTAAKASIEASKASIANARKALDAYKAGDAASLAASKAAGDSLMPLESENALDEADLPAGASADRADDVARAAARNASDEEAKALYKAAAEATAEASKRSHQATYEANLATNEARTAAGLSVQAAMAVRRYARESMQHFRRVKKNEALSRVARDEAGRAANRAYGWADDAEKEAARPCPPPYACTCSCDDVNRYNSGLFTGDKESVACVKSCAEKEAREKKCPPPPSSAGRTACPAVPFKPVQIGPQSQYGSGFEKAAEGFAKKAVGGFLGGFMRGPVSMGGGGGAEEPSLATNPFKKMSEFSDPGTGTAMKIAGMQTDKGLLIGSRIEKGSGKPTFHSITLHRDDCDIMLPSEYFLYELWLEWSLHVSWTRTTYSNGRVVSSEHGEWFKSGSELLDRGVFASNAGGQDAMWRRFGFDRATEGAQAAGALFKGDGNGGGILKTGDKVVVHMTLPDKDPVTTVPFVFDVFPSPDGTLRFERSKSPAGG